MTPSRSDQAGRRGQGTNTGGLSRARLGRMHEIMAGHVARGAVPGLVTLVSRRGEVHVESIGLKAVGGSDLMRNPDDSGPLGIPRPSGCPTRFLDLGLPNDR